MENSSMMQIAPTIGLVVTVISCIACPIIAHNKGRSAVGWFFGGLLLGGIGLIIIAVARDLNSNQQYYYPQYRREEWKCNICGTINYGGYTCKHCGRSKGAVKSQNSTSEEKYYPNGWTCPDCGQKNREEARACIGCGKDKPTKTL